MLDRIFSKKELDAIKDNLFDFPDDLDDLAAVKEKGIVVFGAGAHGKHAVVQLMGAGIRPEWIVDNNPALQGTVFRNIEVLPAQSLSALGSRFVLLTSGYMRSMRQDCLKYGAVNYLLPVNLPIFFMAASAVGDRLEQLEANTELEKLYSQLADKASRQVLKNLLAYQCTLDNKYFTGYGPRDMYFPAGVPLDNTRYVDAGAFDGDTLRDWTARMSPTHPYSALQYMAFEPGPANLALLRETASRLPNELRRNISIYPYGLGARIEKVTFSSEFCLDTAEEQTVDIVTLDSIIGNFAPTMIKADIEGSELDMLEGARNTILKYKPGLAVSVYHKRKDLTDIPAWINALGLKYKIYLRHHRPVVTDTVCYAVVV